MGECAKLKSERTFIKTFIRCDRMCLSHRPSDVRAKSEVRFVDLPDDVLYGLFEYLRSHRYGWHPASAASNDTFILSLRLVCSENLPRLLFKVSESRLTRCYRAPGWVYHKALASKNHSLGNSQQNALVLRAYLSIENGNSD